MRERICASGGCRNAIFLNDDGSVMQRGIGRKDVDQKIVGNQGVEGDSVLDVVAQAFQPLDDDQSACSTLGHGGGRQHGLVDRGLGLLVGTETPQRVASEAGKSTSDLLLKQNNDRKRQDKEETAQELLQGQEVSGAGQVVGNADEEQPEQHLHRPGTPDEQQQIVDDHGHEGDVENIPPADELYPLGDVHS